MRRLLMLGCSDCSSALCGSRFANAADKGVQVVADEAHRRVDITIDGKPFTSYIWPTSLKKPVLYPLITDEGITVTRGYPLEPRPGERVDHPHHAGLWFNYGNVNGFDFWNNSDAIKPEDRVKDGHDLSEKDRLHQERRGSAANWLSTQSGSRAKARTILEETTRYVFSRRKHARIIDQIITLKALDQCRLQ